jgi:predicted RNA-binding Zn-ribbon protein involved in translation (DUF1610 family)
MNNLLSSAENFNTKAYPLPQMSSHPFLRSSVVPAICPKCKAPALHRSHAMSSTDQFRRNFTSKKRFRCHVCSWEGWLDETRLTYPSVSLVGSVPTMNGEEVDIPSILLKDENGRAEEHLPSQAQEERRKELQPSEVAQQLSSRSRRSSDTDREKRSETESKNMASRPSNGHMGIGSETQAAASPPELPEAVAEPYSTPVTQGFHHSSRHKAYACPTCNEYNLFRSRSRDLAEFLRKKFTNKRPYRCHTCGWRGWVIKGL